MNALNHFKCTSVHFFGSPGPFESMMPSGWNASTSSAVALYGTTTTSQSAFHLIHLKSRVSYHNRQEQHVSSARTGIRQILLKPVSLDLVGSTVAFNCEITSSASFSILQMAPFNVPCLRMILVSFRVSIPANSRNIFHFKNSSK